MQWWFCLIHLKVETGPGCPNESRLGPFATEYEAETVLERMHQREIATDDDDE